MITVYWAAPLFTLAEREFNLRCAQLFEMCGYKVILPQVQAEPLLQKGGPGMFRAIAKMCMSTVVSAEAQVLVAILDGSDSDSGTSFEVGARVATQMERGQGICIGVRTDFRSSEDGQTNAMFRMMDKLLYCPSFSTSTGELVQEIDKTIRDLLRQNPD